MESYEKKKKKKQDTNSQKQRVDSWWLGVGDGEKKTHKLTETESRLVVARGRGWGKGIKGYKLSVRR